MAHTLRIKHLKFCAGLAPDSAGLDVAIPHVTILVGPNNSGKSQTLRDIEVWCRGVDQERRLIDEIELLLPDTYDELRSMLGTQKAEPPEGQLARTGNFWIARPVIRQGESPLHQEVNEAALKEWFDNKQLQPVREIFVRSFTLRLDGRTRFDLVEPKPTGHLENHPQNHLWALFVNDERREKVRLFTEEAFGKHFVIDPTGMTEFRVRLSDSEPRSKAEEQALDEVARAFHKAASEASTLGDGVRTSVGLVSAVMSLPDRILLIDEPEAFLHPTLARRVGRVLSETARERDASLIVATHSAELLMGCIQAAPELRLIRLTYAGGQATARSIEPAEVVTLMNDPLLRSANALRALFHRGVVVTEADADRAFYEEINHRLLQAGRGIEDGLFMNAQNWQTIPRIATPLRRLGIPAAAVFDFDVLMDNDFSHIWPLLHIDQAKLSRMQQTRNEIKQLMTEIGRSKIKASGVNAFGANAKRKVERFLNRMAEFGVFFASVGELECWLGTLGVSRTNNKPKWLTDMFARLGSDPAATEYVKARNDDVWKFIDRVEGWINNPKRQGIPRTN